MQAGDIEHLTDIFTQITEAAKANPTVAERVRAALAESGILSVFGAGDTLDVVDLLDAGGEEALRTRLRQMTLSDLKSIVAIRNYDPNKETARWRSPNKFIDLIVSHASEQLEQEVKASSGASWML